MIGHSRRFYHHHLVVYIFHYHPFARCIGHSIVVGRTYVRVHVYALKQFQRLVYVGCILQHIWYGGSCGQVGFVGVLMRFYSIASHQVGNGKSLLVYAVESHKQSRQSHILILKSLWFIILAKVVELHVECSDCFVAFVRYTMHHHANGRWKIEVSAHQYVAIRSAYGQC